MSQQIDGPYITVLAGEALVAFTRVKLSSGDAVYCDAADEVNCIGVTQEPVADNGYVAVKTPGRAGGTVKLRAAGAITAEAYIYAAADGEVQGALAGGKALGIAKEAATAAHDIIECVLFDQPMAPTGVVEVWTAGEALIVNRLVKLTSGKVMYLDETDNGAGLLGTTVSATSAADVDVAVKMTGSAGGRHTVSNATGNIAVGNALYAEDNGQVQTTLASGVVVGYAKTARTGAGAFEAILLDTRPANASA